MKRASIDSDVNWGYFGQKYLLDIFKDKNKMTLKELQKKLFFSN